MNQQCTSTIDLHVLRNAAGASPVRCHSTKRDPRLFLFPGQRAQPKCANELRFKLASACLYSLFGYLRHSDQVGSPVSHRGDTYLNDLGSCELQVELCAPGVTPTHARVAFVI